MRTKSAKVLQLVLLFLVVATLAGVLIGRTLSHGDDFLVFHRVAQRFWDGVRPYDQVTYGNMVFKYPPWILPFFLPFGVLDLFTAKLFWGIIEAASLAFIVYRLHRGYGSGKYPLPGIRPWVQTLLLLIYFGLIGSHGLTGQITLSVIALAVAAHPRRDSLSRLFFLVTALSAKITSLFPLLYIIRRKRLARTFAVIGSLFIVLSLPIYFRSYDRHYGQMREEWGAAMFSGTQDIQSVRIGFTTREVQGLPSLLLRKGGLDEKNPREVLLAIIVSCLVIGGAWAWYSRRLSTSAQWIGWLALLPAVQPLAWFHVFLFTYPLVAWSAEIGLRLQKYRHVAGVFLCALLIGAVTVKTLGTFGGELEFWSVKLWGTLGAVVLFRALSSQLSSQKLGSSSLR